MPTVTQDFTDPYFWGALGHAVINGLGVLVMLCLLATFFVFATGGTAPRNWPKREESEAHTH